MPIYAYRCGSCGLQKDVLQKLSDAPLTVCPSCGEAAFSKQLSAPAFQLKGTGWYVTDFRDNGKKADGGADSKEASTDGDAGSAGKPADDKAAAKSAESGAAAGSSGAGTATPTPAPAPAPAAAPAAGAGGASSQG